MTDPLGVTLPDLRWAAKYLDQISGLMKDVQTSLHGMLGAEGEAWGDDKIGHQFADGAHGYRSQLNWVDGSIAAKTGLLDQYSQALRTTANALEQQDSVWV